MTTPPLRPEDWAGLASLWSDALAWPAAQIEPAIAGVLERLCAMTDSHVGFALAGIRLVDDDSDPLRGWRPGPLYQHRYSSTQQELVARWRRRKANFITDGLTQAVMRRVGEYRVLTFAEVVGAHDASPTAGLLQRLGSSDRMVAGCPLEPDIEVFWGLNRSVEQAPYDERDKALVLAAVQGLVEVARRFVLSHGLVQASRPLSPRERQVLLHLLTGGSEKEIAAKVGLTPHSLHQQVVAVYRKFGVGSRPQLMALWLTGSRPASNPGARRTTRDGPDPATSRRS